MNARKYVSVSCTVYLLYVLFWVVTAQPVIPLLSITAREAILNQDEMYGMMSYYMNASDCYYFQCSLFIFPCLEAGSREISRLKPLTFSLFCAFPQHESVLAKY